MRSDRKSRLIMLSPRADKKNICEIIGIVYKANTFYLTRIELLYQSIYDLKVIALKNRQEQIDKDIPEK